MGEADTDIEEAAEQQPLHEFALEPPQEQEPPQQPHAHSTPDRVGEARPRPETGGVVFQEEAVTILREQLELWSTTAQVSQQELEKEQLTSSKLREEVAALRQECQEAGTSRAVEINELRAKNLRELSASLHELQERNERLRVLQLKNDALEQTVATERTRYEVQLERTEARNLEEINKMQANNLKELAASLHELQDRNERLRELHLKNAELEAELTLEKRSKAEALERSPEERKTPRREEQRSGSVRQFPSLGCMPTGPAPDYPGTHEISAPPSAVASIHSRRAHAARRTPHAARRRAHAAPRTPPRAHRTPPRAHRTHAARTGASAGAGAGACACGTLSGWVQDSISSTPSKM